MTEQEDLTSISDIEDPKELLDLDGEGDVRTTYDHREYPVDMSFEELFDEEKAKVRKKPGTVELKAAGGERIGQYHRFLYDPTVESDDSIEEVDGALFGELGANSEDLTEYASPEALKYLDKIAPSATE